MIRLLFRLKMFDDLLRHEFKSHHHHSTAKRMALISRTIWSQLCSLISWKWVNRRIFSMIKQKVSSLSCCVFKATHEVSERCLQGVAARRHKAQTFSSTAEISSEDFSILCCDDEKESIYSFIFVLLWNCWEKFRGTSVDLPEMDWKKIRVRIHNIQKHRSCFNAVFLTSKTKKKNL